MSFAYNDTQLKERMKKITLKKYLTDLLVKYDVKREISDDMSSYYDCSLKLGKLIIHIVSKYKQFYKLFINNYIVVIQMVMISSFGNRRMNKVIIINDWTKSYNKLSYYNHSNCEFNNVAYIIHHFDKNVPLLTKPIIEDIDKILANNDDRIMLLDKKDFSL